MNDLLNLTDCGNSLPFSGERAFLSVVEADFAVEYAAFFDFDIAGDLGALVRSVESEPDAYFAILALQADLDGPEYHLDTDIYVNWSKHFNALDIPGLHAGDPPLSKQGFAVGPCHIAAAISFGNRTRLQAATASVIIQPTRLRPRWRVLHMQPRF